MDHTPLLTLMADFGFCASLLWLAAGMAAAASSRPRPVSLALLAVAAGLMTIGLWWPVGTLRSFHAPAWFPGWVPPCLLAVLAGAVGLSLERGRRTLATVLAVGMPLAAYLQAMIGVPGVFRWQPGSGAMGAGAWTVLLSVSLVVSQLRWRDAASGRLARLAGCIAAAALLCLGVAVSGDPAAPALDVEWLSMVCLVGMAAVLRVVLQEVPAAADASTPQARRRAAVDSLTGLPTRLQFERRLQRAAKACDAESTALAVLFIDLDAFKPVNDTLGHGGGDHVLEEVGRRLRSLARQIGVAARVGGDGFLMLATNAGPQDAVARLAERVRDELAKPCRIENREVALSCSVGIALYPGDCHPNRLIARADVAMQAAKRAGGGRHCFYTAEMDAEAQQSFGLLLDLRQALINEELELFFQPKIDARSGKVTAAEALLRWNHPTRGLVMPANFIPLAERSGLIGPLGNWVIEAACKQARAWSDKGLRMRVAINLSAYQMRQDDIADRIAESLARHRIHPSLLTCEITETAAMEDTAATQETFRRLGEMGAHLSIDDFGTGYSSLSYLRQLPAEELKIDASFVNDVDQSADARAVVDAVVKLAHALGLKVVAEGVESLRQHSILVELGCDELQGYLFARPMTARALLLWAMDDRSTAAVFRDSLFVESRQAPRQGSNQPSVL